MPLVIIWLILLAIAFYRFFWLPRQRAHASESGATSGETLAGEEVPCPYCGGRILVGAAKCKHCGEWIDKRRAPLNPSQLAIVLIVALILTVVVAHFYLQARG